MATAAEVLILLRARDEASNAINGMGLNASHALSSLQNMALQTTKVFAGISAAIVGFSVKAGFSFNSTLEQAEIGFTRFYGSAEKAKSVLSDLVEFAKVSPFNLKDVIDGARAVAGYGFAAEQTIPMLKTLGDASAATGGDIQLMVRALGQIKASGVLHAQEMNQLANQNIFAWQYMADAYGVSMQQIRKAGEEGLINSNDAVEIILAGINKDYGGLADEMQQSFTGRLNRLRDTFNQFAGNATKPIYEKMKTLMTQLADLMDNPEFQAKALKIVLAIQEAIGRVFTVISQGATWLASSFGPAIAMIVTIVTPVIQAIGYAFLQIQPYIEKFVKWFDEFDNGKLKAAGLAGVISGILILMAAGIAPAIGLGLAILGVIAVFAALGAGVYLLITRFSEVKAAAENMASAAIAKAEQLYASVIEKYPVIGTIVGTIVQAIQNIAAGLSKVPWDALISGAESFGKALIGFAEAHPKIVKIAVAIAAIATAALILGPAISGVILALTGLTIISANFDLIKSKVEEMGNSVVSVWDSINQKMSSGLGGNNLDTGIGGIIDQIQLLIPAVGDFGAALANAFQGIASVLQDSGFLGALANWASSVGSILEGVGAVIAVAGLDFVQNYLSYLTNFIEMFKSILEGDLSGALGNLVGMISSILQMIGDVFVIQGALIVGGVMIIWQTISLVISAFAALGEGIQRYGQLVQDQGGIINGVLGTIIETIGIFVSGTAAVLGDLYSIFSGVFSLIRNLIEGDWAGAWDDAIQIFMGFVDLLSDSEGILFDIGVAIIEGLWDGMKSVWGGVKDWIADRAGDIKDGFASALGVNSPATTMIPIGEGVIEGLQVGMEDSLPNLDTAAGEAVDTISNGLTPAIDIAGSIGADAGNNFAANLIGIVNQAIGEVNAAINTASLAATEMANAAQYKLTGPDAAVGKDYGTIPNFQQLKTFVQTPSVAHKTYTFGSGSGGSGGSGGGGGGGGGAGDSGKAAAEEFKEAFADALANWNTKFPSGIVDNWVTGISGMVELLRSDIVTAADQLNTDLAEKLLNNRFVEDFGEEGAKVMDAFTHALADGTASSANGITSAIDSLVSEMKKQGITGADATGAALMQTLADALATGTPEAVAAAGAAVKAVTDTIKAQVNAENWDDVWKKALGDEALITAAGDKGAKILTTIGDKVEMAKPETLAKLAGLGLDIIDNLKKSLPPELAASLGAQLLAALTNAIKDGGAESIAALQTVLDTINGLLTAAGKGSSVTSNGTIYTADQLNHIAAATGMPLQFLKDHLDIIIKDGLGQFMAGTKEVNAATQKLIDGLLVDFQNGRITLDGLITALGKLIKNAPTVKVEKDASGNPVYGADPKTQNNGLSYFAKDLDSQVFNQSMSTMNDSVGQIPHEIGWLTDNIHVMNAQQYTFFSGMQKSLDQQLAQGKLTSAQYSNKMTDLIKMTEFVGGTTNTIDQSLLAMYINNGLTLEQIKETLGLSYTAHKDMINGLEALKQGETTDPYDRGGTYDAQGHYHPFPTDMGYTPGSLPGDSGQNPPGTVPQMEYWNQLMNLITTPGSSIGAINSLITQLGFSGQADFLATLASQYHMDPSSPEWITLLHARFPGMFQLPGDGSNRVVVPGSTSNPGNGSGTGAGSGGGNGQIGTPQGPPTEADSLTSSVAMMVANSSVVSSAMAKVATDTINTTGTLYEMSNSSSEFQKTVQHLGLKGHRHPDKPWHLDTGEGDDPGHRDRKINVIIQALDMDSFVASGGVARLAQELKKHDGRTI